MNKNTRINVTSPLLPPLNEYEDLLKEIWERKWITNSGHFHDMLRKQISEFLGVRDLSLCTNGTIALSLALKALNIKGEVITTPYSFVATANSIVNNGSRPVFCDIDPVTCNISPDEIRRSITPRTEAILPVHVYGNPCDVTQIREIADENDLKVIYDAAHCFGGKYRERSILEYGDISTISFHATKVFSTIEGGGVVTKDDSLRSYIDQLINFGFKDEITLSGIGMNGKLNEIQSAFGLVTLKYIQDEMVRRRKISDEYRRRLSDIDGISLLKREEMDIQPNPYFPIFIDSKDSRISRDGLYSHLKNEEIYSRKYFYPLITDYSPFEQYARKHNDLKNAKKVSQEVLCIPIFGNLSQEGVDRICDSIGSYSRN